MKKNEMDYKDMNSEDLLREMVINQKKMRFHDVVALIVNFMMLAVLTFVVVFVIPRAQQLADTITNIAELSAEARDSLDQIDSVVSNANVLIERNTDEIHQVLTNINKLDFEVINSTVKDVDKALVANEEEIQNTLKSLNEIDMQSLNVAINELSDAVGTFNGVVTILRNFQE